VASFRTRCGAISVMPRISLIVCTRNRGERLYPFLECISRLESPPGGWEFVLVDNGSTDDTGAIIEAFARQAPVVVRRVFEPTPGLACARNAGLAAASGEVLAFTDDDCYPQSDFLRAVSEAFRDRRTGFIGGRVLLHDPADARIAVKEVEEPVEIAPHSYVRPGVIHGANMAVAREVVRTIGGFDPQLGAGSRCVAGEDTEYLARASWAGWRGRYDPGPVVSHHHGRKPGPDAERHVLGYDYGRGAYYARFMLHRTAWRTYLRQWWRHVMKSLRRARYGKLRREAIGAARYLRGRMFRLRSVPRFDRW
jgi:glycosyltransferase involved in cell wall biosynthesis